MSVWLGKGWKKKCNFFIYLLQVSKTCYSFLLNYITSWFYSKTLWEIIFIKNAKNTGHFSNFLQKRKVKLSKLLQKDVKELLCISTRFQVHGRWQSLKIYFTKICSIYVVSEMLGLKSWERVVKVSSKLVYHFLQHA